MPCSMKVPWHFQTLAAFGRDPSLSVWGWSDPAVCKKVKSNGELLPLLPDQHPKHRWESLRRRGFYAFELQKLEICLWLCLIANHKTCRDESTARTSAEEFWTKIISGTERAALNTKNKITSLICHLSSRWLQKGASSIKLLNAWPWTLQISLSIGHAISFKRQAFLKWRFLSFYLLPPQTMRFIFKGRIKNFY